VKLAGYDGYVAGPPAMMSSVVDKLAAAGVERDRIRIDSFGL
jgi:Na+-transporting NADH:ubiquinone oxidoreductase subunit NqrF